MSLRDVSLSVDVSNPMVSLIGVGQKDDLAQVDIDTISTLEMIEGYSLQFKLKNVT